MAFYNIFFLCMGYCSLVTGIPTAVPGLLTGRYNFFMNQPWFTGLPNLGGEGGPLSEFTPIVDLMSQADVFVKDLEGNTKLGGRSALNSDSESEGDNNKDEWAGRHDSVKLANTGTDVIKVFKENLKARLEKVSGSQSQSKGKGECDEQCKDKPSSHRAGWCALDCLVKEQEDLKNIMGELFQGIMSYCSVLDTIYTRFNEFGIYSLEKFLNLAVRIDNPVLETAVSIPFRALLTRLIREVKTPIMPMRNMLQKFQFQLTNLKTKTKANDGILISENPGCAQIYVIDAISAAIDMIAKNPALTDYVVFQGYALVDALAKYVDDFPLKKNFAAQHFVYDVMMGTTCGLYLYGSKSETTDCDQYGGFPVIDMPVPTYMWTDENQDECEYIKEKLVLKSGGGGAPNTKRKRQVGGRGKSMKVGGKR